MSYFSGIGPVAAGLTMVQVVHPTGHIGRDDPVIELLCLNTKFFAAHEKSLLPHDTDHRGPELECPWSKRDARSIGASDDSPTFPS